jgi:hypothetical protein
MADRRFPPPWSIEEHTESFIVKDANGQALAYLYFEDEPQRQLSTKRSFSTVTRQTSVVLGLLIQTFYFL